MTPASLSRLVSLGLISLLTLQSACAPRQGDAIRLTIDTAEGRAETCYLVELFDEPATSRLASVKFPRDETKRTYVVAIGRRAFPATVSLRATALVGADCETATRPNGVSATIQVTFDPQRIVPASLSLTEGDADTDGFVATARGGEDCNDSDRTISPGEREVCFGDVDHDCNGKPPCMDMACVGMPCGGTPTQLRFLNTPSPIRVNECAGPLSIEVQDAVGNRTSPAMGGTVTLASTLEFFTDAMCNAAPVTQLTLVSTQNVWLRATTPQSAVISVMSPGLMGDSRPVEVLGSAPAAVRFDGMSQRAAAGGCSSEVIVALVDDAGSRATLSQPVVVSLSSDAGAPFAFFADLACMNQITAIAVLDGGASGVYFSGQRAGAFTLRGESSGLQPAEQPALIDPGATAGLVITTPSQPVAATECAGPFAVRGRDAYGNLTVVTNPMVSIVDGGATVFTTTTCGMAGQPASAFGIVFPNEGTYDVNASAGGFTASQSVLARNRGPTGSLWRWPIAVTTDAMRRPTPGYDKYTVTVSLNSQGAVDAGQLDPSLSNLRVYFASDAGWRELDRLISNSNTNNTAVRFALQTDLANAATDTRYALFAGPFDGGPGLSDPNAVYLFFDDFESGTLSKWTIRSGGWVSDTARAHSGTSAMKFPTEAGASDKVIAANPALTEADVLFEAWWNTGNPGVTNFSQLVRLQPSVITTYEMTCEDANGWTIARETNAAWTEMGSNSGTVDANTWMRLSIAMHDRDILISRNGVQLGGTVQAPMPVHPAGNVGFRKYNIGGDIWIDDVSVRRFVLAEPAVSLGTPFALPSP
ncbi:MAG: putative metal-binding motif-containing protein [Archangium sp.]|nr:putative metal-binding motif-containing protein [Archangium sp.]